MEIKELKELQDSVKKHSEELKGWLSEQQDEFKNLGSATKETSEKIASIESEFSKSVKAFDDFETRLAKMEAAANRSGTGAARVKSLGQQFVESDVYAEMKGIGRGTDKPFFEQKDISNGAGSAGAVTQAMQVPSIFSNPNRSIYVRDLVNHMPTQTDAVKVVRETSFTNNAAPQAGQLAAVGKSDIVLSEETYSVETIAHHKIASRQILADAPRLRAFIDGKLSYGLDLVMDQQLLFGSGTGNNFTGLMVDDGVTDIGASAALDGTAWIDHIRKAVTACQLNEYYNVNGVIVNPADWETLELTKGSDGHYIWVSVPQGGEMRLWRVPVIVTNAMAQGSFLLGDWTLGATLYDREQRSVRISESHQDLFTKLGVAILAEERSAFAIELPLAFTKGTLTEATPPV